MQQNASPQRAGNLLLQFLVVDHRLCAEPAMMADLAVRREARLRSALSCSQGRAQSDCQRDKGVRDLVMVANVRREREDASTWIYRDRMVESGVWMSLLDGFDRQVDATLVEVLLVGHID